MQRTARGLGIGAAILSLLASATACSSGPADGQGYVELGAKDGAVESHFCQPLTPGDASLGVAETLRNSTDHDIEIVGVAPLDAKGISASNAAMTLLPDGDQAIYGWTSTGLKDSKDVRDAVGRLDDAPLILPAGQTAVVASRLTPDSNARSVDVRQLEVQFRHEPGAQRLSSARGDITFEFRAEGCDTRLDDGGNDPAAAATSGSIMVAMAAASSRR